MSTVRIELPQKLRDQIREFVDHGWFSNESDLVQEAIRRFLEAREPELMSRFVREDVEWGLRGDE